MPVDRRATNPRLLRHVRVRHECGPKINEQAARSSQDRLAAALEPWVGLGRHR